MILFLTPVSGWIFVFSKVVQILNIKMSRRVVLSCLLIRKEAANNRSDYGIAFSPFYSHK